MGKSEMRSALVFLVVIAGIVLSAPLWSGMPAIAATATLNVERSKRNH